MKFVAYEHLALLASGAMPRGGDAGGLPQPQKEQAAAVSVRSGFGPRSARASCFPARHIRAAALLIRGFLLL